MKPIPYGKQYISKADIKAVTEALQSEFLTQGPKIFEFEKAFAKYVGSDYAVAVNNGTAALHLCTLALNINEHDNVITTPITFVASANCIRYCNANVYFADINPRTYLIDIKSIEKLILSKPKGFFTGIIVVDFAGRAVNLEAFRKLADKHGLWIIEDACHAPGAYFTDTKGRKQNCGNGHFADMAIFSFHPVKHIATGEGGMITTNDKTLYEKLILYRTHGITRNPLNFLNSKEFATGLKSETYPSWYMEMQELGYNYRLTDLQAALGISQLKRASTNLLKRKEIALRYDIAFKNHKDIISPQIETLNDTSFSHAYHLYIICVKNRIGLYDFLRKNNIYCQVHYIPAHLMPYYKSLGWKEGDFPKAEKYYTQCLSLPMYPTLTKVEQRYVIEKVTSYFNNINNSKSI